MKRIVSRILLGIVALLCISSSVFAAGINSEEQRVISTVSQPFFYEGKTYVVNSGNIAEGRAKLAEEGVDLTKNDADSCIAQFQQSYGELVAEGYCQEYGKSDDDTEIQKAPKVEHSKSESELSKAFLEKVLGSPVKEEDFNGESSEKKEEIDAPTPVPYVWLTEESTIDKIEFDEEDITHAVKKEVVLFKGENEYMLYGGEEKSLIGEYTGKYLSVWKIVWLIVALITVLVVLGMCAFLLRAHRKGKKRFRKKKYFRRALAALGGVCVMAWAGFLLLSMGLYFGVYSKSVIHQQLMESNYFSGITQMVQIRAAGQMQEAGYDPLLAEEIFGLSNVYIEEKQYIDDVLSGKEDARISVERIHEKLIEDLNTSSNKKDTALIRSLEEDYKNILEFELGKGIQSSKTAFMKWFYITVVSGVLAIVLLVVLLYKMYHRLYKTATVGACGLFMASWCMAVFGMAIKLSGLEEKVLLKPAFYQEFVQQYILNSVQILLYVSGLGILLAVSLFVWKYHLKKNYDI